MSRSLDKIMENLDNPTHLNCPYCPAQSYPLRAAEINVAPNVYLQRFECPAKHFFYIPEDISFYIEKETDGRKDEQLG